MEPFQCAGENALRSGDEIVQLRSMLPTAAIVASLHRAAHVMRAVSLCTIPAKSHRGVSAPWKRWDDPLWIVPSHALHIS